MAGGSSRSTAESRPRAVELSVITQVTRCGLLVPCYAILSIRRDQLGPDRLRLGVALATAKVSNEVSNAAWVEGAGQPLRLPAPQRDSLRLCDTTCWCSRRESNPEPWD